MRPFSQISPHSLIAFFPGFVSRGPLETPLLGGWGCCRRNACSRRGVGIRVSQFLAFCNPATHMLTGLRLWNSPQNVCVCGGRGGGLLWERMLEERCWWLGHLRPQLGSSGPLLTSLISVNLLDFDRSLLPCKGVSSPSLKVFK